MMNDHPTTDVLVLVLVLHLDLALELLEVDLEGMTIPGDQGHSTTTPPLSRGY